MQLFDGTLSLTPVAFFLLMYLCYVDESGTPEIPGTSDHFILAGLAIPIWHWKGADRDIYTIKRTYDLCEAELHTAWLLRRYPEQESIPDFESLNHPERRRQVEAKRRRRILDLQRANDSKRLKSVKKNYRKTEGYIHLTLDERKAFVSEVAQKVGTWGYARLFAECIDKVHFSPANSGLTPEKQAFEQVISRFEHYLSAIGSGYEQTSTYGLIIHDNNETVAKKHTSLMKKFHRDGTFFTRIQNIIETPLFVDSELTSIIQLADLCSYAFRRYLENGEETLLDFIFPRIDRRNDALVGIRHYTPDGCTCKICSGRGRNGH